MLMGLLLVLLLMVIYICFVVSVLFIFMVEFCLWGVVRMFFIVMFGLVCLSVFCSSLVGKMMWCGVEVLLMMRLVKLLDMICCSMEVIGWVMVEVVVGLVLSCIELCIVCVELNVSMNCWFLLWMMVIDSGLFLLICVWVLLFMWM